MPIEFQSPSGGPHSGADPSRSVLQSLLRGFVRRCPKCGTGRMFRSYLKTVDACGNCGEVAEAAVLCPSFYRADVVHHASRWEKRLAGWRGRIIGALQRRRAKRWLHFDGVETGA